MILSTDLGRPIRIVATAEYLPGPAVPSTYIDKRLRISPGTTEQRLAIRSRHFAGQETSSDMAARAAQRALERAGWDATDLDLIISACSVMEQPIPSQAILIQRRLGLERKSVPAWDLNATCLSFLVALDTISHAIVSGQYRRVLLVSSELPSSGLDWSNLEVCGNFGDGAAAVLLERAAPGESSILTSRFETFSEGASLCELRTGGTRTDLKGKLDQALQGAVFRMNGPSLYRLVAKKFPRFFRNVLSGIGLDLQQLSLVIPHQASAKANQLLRDRLRIPIEKLVDIYADHGNQVAASIPAALHHAIDQGRLQRGDSFMLVGTSAGVSLGGMVLRY